MNATVLVRREAGGHIEELELPVHERSAMVGLLGDHPQVDAECFDDIAEFLGDAPTRITLRGLPGSCLAPALWIRTALADAETVLRLEWTLSGREPSDAERIAALMAAELADDVVSDDPTRTRCEWGVEDGARRRTPEAILDAMEGLIDRWDLANNAPTLSSPMGGALRVCADRGLDPIALYGAGTHTRAVGSQLADPPVRIDCVIDDDERRHGDRIWNFPIVSLDGALDRGVRAIVLSANSVEDVLWERTAPARDRGVEVIRLYTNAEASGDGGGW